MAQVEREEDDINPMEKFPQLQKLVQSCKTCADCDCKKLEWASINLGIFLCSQCAGVHRSLGTHISKVRSLYLDCTVWSNEQINHMKNNEEFNEEWEYCVPKEYIKPRAESSRQLREKYIKAKYQYTMTKKSDNNNTNENDNSFKVWSPFSKEQNLDSQCSPPIYDDSLSSSASKQEGQGMIQFNGVLEIFVKHGKDMPRADVGGEIGGKQWGGSCDPYLLFDSGAQQVKTKIVKDTYNPVWNERIQLSVKEDVAVKIKLFDWDLGEFNQDDFLGEAELDVKTEIMSKGGQDQHVEITKYFKLEDVYEKRNQKKNKRASITFTAKYTKMA